MNPLSPVCFGYGRHSTKKQDITEEVQQARCEEYYTRMLKPMGVQWGGWFYDPATQGKKPISERTEGRQVFAMLRPGDHLVFAKLDRAFRSVADGCSTIEQLANRKVTVHSLDLQIDTSTAIGKFFRTILLAVAELERDFTCDRVNETIAYRKAKGLPYCHSCPIGWRMHGVKPRRYFRVDMDERALCDAMAELRAKGASQNEIALWCIKQTQFETKRRFTDRSTVRWALMAREHNYPRITNYKDLRRMVRDGTAASLV